MSNPAYLWLTDENGSPVTGSTLVKNRVGSIELLSVRHNISIPSDGNTGRLTATRIHSPVIVRKEFDSATPYLYRALCEGKTLRSATLKMYQITDAGVEQEYFNITFQNVKLTSITPDLFPGGTTGTHFEEVHFRYETVTWKYTRGNILYSDTWNHRVCA